jgi:hypothetical protein
VQLRRDQVQAVFRICGVSLSQVTPVWSAMANRNPIAEDRPPIRREIVLAVRQVADVIGFVGILSGDDLPPKKWTGLSCF